MPRPRKELVSLEDTPYYHVISRCVRRAFLCGEDIYSGESYEHRKPWFIERLNQLSSVFSIGICSYVVMSNHYHLVVRIEEDVAGSWSDKEVVRRWHALFKLPEQVECWYQSANDGEMGHEAAESASAIVDCTPQILEKIQSYRARLCDLSWFMRCLNEHIARQANAEDGCTGRFWEGRYRSVALLDDEALLSAMVYVDLNPVRAGIAKTPETSEYTSVKDRIVGKQFPGLVKLETKVLKALDPNSEPLPFKLPEYLDLVDWSSRIERLGKRGYILNNLPPILSRLNIDPENWSKQLQPQHQRNRLALGTQENLRSFCKSLGQNWIWGIGKRFPREVPVPS